MSKINVPGNLLDSFHIAFCHDKWAIDALLIASKIEEELHDRLHVCRKLNKTYVVNVLITELEGERDAISQRKESEDEERILRKRQA